MVRLKHRYLLVNILYPEDSKDAKFSKIKDGSDVSYTLQFRRPSDDRVDGKLLARLIRDGVAELFGDYGSGMIASSLQGNLNPTVPSQDIMKLMSSSQILLSGNKHSDHPRGARPLPPCLVCSHLRHASAQASEPSLCDAGRQSFWNDQEG